MRLNCPSTEALFELVSIPTELTLFKRFSLKAHARGCGECQTRIDGLTSQWQSFIRPEADVTSSLLRVYARLQQDETLVLKGWKLGETRSKRSDGIVREWAFRGSVAAGLMGLLVYVAWPSWQPTVPGKQLENASANLTPISRRVPYAQIRVEDKNSLKVHYVRPELLQTIEFETTNGR